MSAFVGKYAGSCHSLLCFALLSVLSVQLADFYVTRSPVHAQMS
jgi:hypothetical protein